MKYESFRRTPPTVPPVGCCWPATRRSAAGWRSSASVSHGSTCSGGSCSGLTTKRRLIRIEWSGHLPRILLAGERRGAGWTGDDPAAGGAGGVDRGVPTGGGYLSHPPGWG